MVDTLALNPGWVFVLGSYYKLWNTMEKNSYFSLNLFVILIDKPIHASSIYRRIYYSPSKKG